MQKIVFPQERPIDIACLGRLAVDLYGEAIGVGLEHTHSFKKYLGGSSANIAFGTARLGLNSAMISRVGNEQMGRFLLETLEREGCDTSQVLLDPERLTALVFLALKDQDTFPLLFYRRDCADMALCEDDIDENFFKRCKALLVTGTHLSTDTTLKASRKALQAARQHQAITILDIDYRPVLWGLTELGDGETRYIKSDSVSVHLQTQLPLFDLIIGTEEEFSIAGGSEDILQALRTVRQHTQAVLVLKRGVLGCQIISGEIPDSLDTLTLYKTEQVEVMNVLGAGDAFASGLIYALIRGYDFAQAARIANICGAIVVSRHGCAPAMPTPDELNYWLNQPEGLRPDLDSHLQHLHRVSGKRISWPEVYVLAFDHRSQFEDIANRYAIPRTKITQLKQIVFQALTHISKQRPELSGKLGILADDTYAKQVLCDASESNPPLWIGRPVEQPSSRPLSFEHTYSIASKIKDYPLEHTIKCLVFYHPEDDLNIRMAQERQLLALWESVQHSGHELLLEVIAPNPLPAHVSDKDNDSIILRSIARFYHLGIKPHWWKLVGMQSPSWHMLDQLIEQHDPYCRGVVLLGLNQPKEVLCAQFKQATHPIVKGFMIGRSVWQQPICALLEEKINVEQCRQQISENFTVLIDAWQTRTGVPHEH